MVTRLLRGSVLVLLAACLALAPTAASAGGGGCHDQSTTDGTGLDVALAENCFGPTILRVGVGDTVTWHNKDQVDHTVTAAAGLFDAILSYGKQTSYRFAAAGVFPYYCIYHPRMAGAVVVGDGQATPVGTSAGAVNRVVPAATVTTPKEDASSGSSTALLALVSGLGGILIGNAPRIARRARAKS